MPKKSHIDRLSPSQDDDDPYGLIRDDVHESISECDRFFESLKAELKALKPMPKRPRSPEPPPEEPELSPDAKAARTMLALGNLRIGRSANAFYAEALEYIDREVKRRIREAIVRDVTINVTGNQTGSEKFPADEQMSNAIKPLRGRPPTGKALSVAERKRRSRERQRGAVGEPEVTIVKGKLLVDPAFFQEPMEDDGTPEQDFENSLSAMAGMSISLPAHWTKQLGDWKDLPATSIMVALAKEASETWAMIARELKHRRK
jgi:hypothetical protein